MRDSIVVVTMRSVCVRSEVSLGVHFGGSGNLHLGENRDCELGAASSTFDPVDVQYVDTVDAPDGTCPRGQERLARLEKGRLNGPQCRRTRNHVVAHCNSSINHRERCSINGRHYLPTIRLKHLDKNVDLRSRVEVGDDSFGKRLREEDFDFRALLVPFRSIFPLECAMVYRRVSGPSNSKCDSATNLNVAVEYSVLIEARSW